MNYKIFFLSIALFVATTGMAQYSKPDPSNSFRDRHGNQVSLGQAMDGGGFVTTVITTRYGVVTKWEKVESSASQTRSCEAWHRGKGETLRQYMTEIQETTKRQYDAEFWHLTANHTDATIGATVPGASIITSIWKWLTGNNDASSLTEDVVGGASGELASETAGALTGVVGVGMDVMNELADLNDDQAQHNVQLDGMRQRMMEYARTVCPTCGKTDWIDEQGHTENTSWLQQEEKHILRRNAVPWPSLSQEARKHLYKYAVAQKAYDDGSTNWMVGDATQVDIAIVDAELNSNISELVERFRSMADGVKGLSVSFFQDMNGTYTIAFRGTDDWKDAKSDWKLWLGKMDAQIVAASAIVNELANGSGQSVNLTGHSLGGYLAVVAGMKCNTKVGHVYTYNSPGLDERILKSFDENEKRLMSSRVTNVWHSNDFVHTVNESWTGDSVAVDGSRHIGRNIEISEYAGLGDRVCQVFVSMTGFGSTISDHSIDTLVKRMESNLN